MSLKPFQYYLLTEDGRSHYVQNGIVSSRGIPTPLPQTPDGWQDVSFGWERNKGKHGLQRAFSKELGFVMDGATIVRDAFYKSNVDRKMYLLIQKLGLQYTTSYKWLYETLYKGELDLSTVKDRQDGMRVDVSIMEGGLSKMLNANLNTVYEIPFDDDAVDVELDGIIMQRKQTWLLPFNLLGGDDLVGMYRTVNDGSASGVAVFDISNQDEPGDLTTSNEYFLIATRALTDLRLQGSYVIVNILGSSVTLRLKSSTGQNIALGTLSANGTITIDQTFNAAEGEKFFLVADISGVAHTITESSITLTVTSRHPATNCKAFTRETLFRKLCRKIFGHEEYAVSTLLETDDRLITSFDAIRGIDNPTLKTSLQDFFTDLDTDLMAGMGIEAGTVTTNLPAGERLVIETRTRFYDDSEITDLGEVKELTVAYAADKIVSKIKTGWQEPQAEDVNGKKGFNASQTYTTPQLRINNEYNLVSPYKADPFEIENVRINMEGKETTDNNNDNNVAVLWAELDGSSYILKRETYDNEGDPDDFGVPSPTTVFNVDLSPKRKLLRHGRWLASMLHRYETEKITFQSGTRNTSLKTVQGSTTIRENGDVSISSLGEKVFIPYVFSVVVDGDLNLPALMEDNPNRCFKFTWNGVEYKGFNLIAAFAPNELNEQEYRLLSTPDNDLTDLIV